MNLQPANSDIKRDPRWAALCVRDRAADGRFVYSVATTGVYCRPSCAARRPRPENVRFHATHDDAEHAGFRACRRCHPREKVAAPQVIRFAIGESTLGLVLVARSDSGLRAVLFGDEAGMLVHDLQSRLPEATLAVDSGGVQASLDAVVDCIEAPHLSLDGPVDLQGTPFQTKVWRELRRIPRARP